MCAMPSWRFFPILPASMVYAGLGRPRPARLEFAAGPSSPSGLSAPRESVGSGVRVSVRRTSIPSWAFPSLRCSPRPRVERISPLLLSRAFANRTPEGVRPAGAPECHPSDAVALPLSRPPDRCEVPRLRTTRLFGPRAALAYCFASSPRWRRRSVKGPLQTAARIRPE